MQPRPPPGFPWHPVSGRRPPFPQGTAALPPDALLEMAPPPPGLPLSHLDYPPGGYQPPPVMGLMSGGRPVPPPAPIRPPGLPSFLPPPPLPLSQHQAPPTLPVPPPAFTVSPSAAFPRPPDGPFAPPGGPPGTAASRFLLPSARPPSSFSIAPLQTVPTGPSAKNPPVSVDQRWLDNWLAGHAIESTEDSVRCVPTEDLIETIASSSERFRELKENAAKLEGDSLTDSERAETIRKCAALQEELERALDPLTHEGVLRRLRLKMAKRNKHRNWKKRRVKANQTLRRERRERRERMHKEQDDWRLEIIAAEKEKTQREKASEVAQIASREADRKRKRQKELGQILQKLQKLRDMRREKLKKTGHYFPEEDNEFFNRVAAMSAAAAAAEGEQAAASATASEAGQQGQQQERGEEEAAAVAGDPVRAFWRQANDSVANLIKIRRKWDAYIVPRGVKRAASRIPPSWVDPAPPGNAVWANYLCSEPLELSESDECNA